MCEDDGLENTLDAENRIKQPLQRLRRGNGLTVGGAVPAAVGGANNNDNNIGENLNINDGIIGENRPAVEKINYVDGMNGNTLLMDIDPQKFGTFLGLANTVIHIPRGYVEKTSKAYVSVLVKVIENPLDADSWKKMILLATVLYANFKGKLQVNQRLNLVIEDNWSKLNLEQFANECVLHSTMVMMMKV